MQPDLLMGSPVVVSAYADDTTISVHGQEAVDELQSSLGLYERTSSESTGGKVRLAWWVSGT